MFYIFCLFFAIGCVFSIACILACLRGQRGFVLYIIETLWLFAIGEMDIEFSTKPMEDIVDELTEEMLNTMEKELNKRLGKKEDDN